MFKAPKALVVDYAHRYFPVSDILGGTRPSPFPSQWGMNSFTCICPLSFDKDQDVF